jgi:hypothetical protein
MTNYSIENNLPLPVLNRTRELPIKPRPVTLDGKYVRLVPLDLARDTAPFFEMSKGSVIILGDRSIAAYDRCSQIWQYMSGGPFVSVHEVEAFLRQQVEAKNGLCFCVFDCRTGRQIGVANYVNNTPTLCNTSLPIG